MLLETDFKLIHLKYKSFYFSIIFCIPPSEPKTFSYTLFCNKHMLMTSDDHVSKGFQNLTEHTILRNIPYVLNIKKMMRMSLILVYQTHWRIIWPSKSPED